MLAKWDKTASCLLISLGEGGSRGGGQGVAALTPSDWTLLESRVCGHGHNKGKNKCCKFKDIVLPQRSKKRDYHGKSRSSGEIVTEHLHCPIADGATVIAALREKVHQIIALHIDGQRRANVRIHSSEAVDTGPMGLNVTNEHTMAATDKKARSQLRSLSMYVGMRALLTINAVLCQQHLTRAGRNVRTGRACLAELRILCGWPSGEPSSFHLHPLPPKKPKK